MDTRKNFPIHGLSDRDAWNLFKRTAGSCIESDPELHVVAKRILKECSGLPIAISTVGTALKCESIGIWKNALWELEKASPENVPGVIEHVYGKIKLSYECLPSEQAKSCLLLCCIFKESADIRIEVLVRYGLGLGLLKGVDSMVEGRNRMETLVQTLKSRFLLLDSNKKGCVKMHDVVRDVAVYIASEESVESKNDGVGKSIVVREKAETGLLVDWPKNSEKFIHCTSLSSGGLCQLFLLNGNWSIIGSESELPPTVFSKMKELKVLAIKFWSPGLLVPSLAVLKRLQTLRLEHCYFERDVSVIGELRTLMILSLRGSDIKQLPDTFKYLSDLRVLDLINCYKLEIIPPGVISSLTRFKELYMWNSFQDWAVEKLASTKTTNWISQLEAELRAGPKEPERIFVNQIKKTTVETWKKFQRLAVEQPTKVGKLFREEVEDVHTANEEHTRWANSMEWNTGILAELLTLSRLTTLQVVLPPVNELLSSSLFNKLERFKISIGWKERLPEWKSKHDGNYLRVHGLDASAAVGSGITSLLEKASVLDFKLTQPQLVKVLDTVCFAKIKSLKFDKCDAVEYLIDMKVLVKPATSPHGCNGILPVLNSLEISGASRLKEIFHGELPTQSLNELQSLELRFLPALTYIWKTKSQSDQWGLLRNILGLIQVLKIEECESLEEIVAFEDDEKEINFQSLDRIDSLKSIKLHRHNQKYL
ncbi:hypothetical protein ACLB2K_018640 [Fragaria x ananassa]